jgi:hypothetical protein
MNVAESDIDKIYGKHLNASQYCITAVVAYSIVYYIEYIGLGRNREY